jgi:phage baseplate assembly protein gpV
MKAMETLPDIEIVAGGVKLLPETTKFLESLRVSQALSAPSQCEIVFSGKSLFLPEADRLFEGELMIVRVTGSVFPLFEGRVTAVEYKYRSQGEEQIFIRGYDALYMLGKKQRVYTYAQASLGDIAREILGTAFSLEMTGDDPVWDRIVQYNETDLAFLARISQRSGYYFFCKGQSVYMCSLRVKKDGRIIKKLTRGKNLLECSVRANGAGALTAVETSGWNPSTGEFHEAETSGSLAGSEIRFNFSEAAKKMAGKRTLVDIAVKNTHEARTVAQSELDRCTCGNIVFTGVAEGDPALYPGVAVTIQGIKNDFCGNYLLTKSTHSIDARLGYLTTVNTEPPDFRPLDQGTNATFGIVTDSNDPENMGRIKVVLDSYAEMETDWMNVVLPSAGKGKGLVMLPDTGDRVLVLFMNNDPARGVVLGGVVAAEESSHSWGVEDGEIKKYFFISPAGNKISLDDYAKTVKMENSDGSYMEMGPDKMKLYSKIDFEIEAPGKNITIKGDSIDFKKG